MMKMTKKELVSRIMAFVLSFFNEVTETYYSSLDVNV
jgi:hypothetical protein